MLLLRRWLVALCVLTPFLAWSQASPPAGVTRVTAVEGITEYRLPNGLQVLLVPDDAKPTPQST